MVIGSVIAGASGGALANVALSPLSGGAGMIQSYWYGAGLILGERDMYTFHWEKIKKRLEGGEDYLSVLESEMNPAITAIANYSLQIMHKTGQIYLKGGIDFMAQLIENLFKLLAGEKVDVLGDIDLGSGGTGVTTAELLTTSLTEIRSWSIEKLKNERDRALRGEYTAAAKILILDEYQRMLEATQEQEQIALDVRDVIWKAEAEYLKWLATVTIAAIKGGAFSGNKFVNDKIRINYGDLSTRARSAGSDARLQEWRDNLLTHRRSLLLALKNDSISSYGNYHQNINLAHTMIWIHQLIYI